jgi:hypothetical protein
MAVAPAAPAVTVMPWEILLFFAKFVSMIYITPLSLFGG